MDHSEIFKGNFTQQEPIPEAGIEAALEVMRSGRLHRYNVADGEAGETALLEVEFARAMGSKYCLAVASGGYAMATALRASAAVTSTSPLANASAVSGSILIWRLIGACAG